MKDNKTMVIWVLAVVLVLVLGYMGYAMYQNYRANQQNQILQYGAQLGYQQANDEVAVLLQPILSCQTVPVMLGNVSVNLVAVECLQVPAEQ